MAPEKQEKKRKQAPAVALTSEAPQKRLKKQKVTKDAPPLASNLSKTKTPSSAISDAVPPPVADTDFAAVKSKKDRKRAADFLSDNGEDNGEDAESREERKETDTKPKKKAKKLKSEQSETVKASTEEAVTPQLTTKVKSQKMAKVPKDPGSDVTAKGAKKAKTEWPTNEMTQVVNKVLSNGDSLTADGVNGILEHSSEEDVDITTANEDPSSSMQAEAQRTVDKEMADEVATEDESDDQGAALLAGFDSDGDDSGEDEGLDPANMADLNLNKQQRKKLRQATRKESKEGTGAVYVGRIPRGFYEAQMRQYFSQFGTITNLRLSRNKTTGASKHFAFIEFESNEVAKIVAQTMDNYLMFGHILKCKYAPSESLHPDTWKGANKRFKIVPYNKIEKRMLEEPKTKDQWEGKIAREQNKREKRLSKAQSMGYHYELPEIQGVEAALERKKLVQQVDSKAIERAGALEEPTGAIEPPNGVPKDTVAPKGRQRKRSKAKSAPATENLDVETPAKSPSAEVILPQKASKVKKGGAASDGIPLITLTEAHVDTAPNVDKPTGKKAKKTKKTAATSEAAPTLPTTSIEAETVAPVSATEATKPAPVETKKPKKQANVPVAKFTKSTPAPPGGTVDAAALVRQKSLERDAPPAKFAFHPDEIAELTKPKEAESEAMKPKTKTKKQKKSKATATDAAAAQMQLNAELNDTVSPLVSKGKGKDRAVESDVEIAATATAVLPTPGGGERKAKAGKKAKLEKRKVEVEELEPKKAKKVKKAKVEA